MATMNFSVPAEIKERFNQTFANANKSAIIAKLMEDALAQEERKRGSDKAVRRILKRRKTASMVSTKEILRARDQLRAESDTGHVRKAR